MRMTRALLPVLLAAASSLALASQASATQAQAAGKYVALGDSYAVAVGTRSYDNPDDACRRGPLAYTRLYAAAHPEKAFVEASCSGATTADIPGQLAQVTPNTTLVTLQVGGNDVGFVDVLTNCILTIDDAACVNGVELAKAAATSQLSPALGTLYAQVRAAAPNAQIIVVGYPRLYKIGGNCGIFGLSDTERTALNSASDTLAGIMSQRAAAAGLTFLDVRPLFDPHAICAGGTTWVTSLEWDKINESYHPNTAGHQGIFQAINGMAARAAQA
ncbi:SGNH/GDSL hydrolase family protein [Actinokineospora bangkokensis]|uniref:GDSL family lipase n=1 Tax=Actinokineospora bangkokensis TaxID=1193682 RepID=A0A1Q9LJM5_9PSEU|nr:SGNH/GDSL hydrolase family protein [Actinokineospora bangkokensis]OLR92203.1 GDSL family lipase [Actinokineospora bangkokensis]